MVKAQEAVAAARFATEVAPPQVLKVVRRRNKVLRSLDTIAEDDREQQLLLACGGSPSSPRMPPQPRERAGGLMTTELGSNYYYFSDNHGRHAQEL